MATIVQSYNNEGSATKATVTNSPQAQVVCLTDGEGTLNPVVKENAGYVAFGQTAKVYTGTQALAAGPITIALETVTAGKIFFITDIYVGANTGVVFSVQITAAGVPIYNGFSKGDTGAISLMGIETQPQASSGQLVNLILGLAAGTTAAYMINGIEQ
jgi:hypothetical protein